MARPLRGHAWPGVRGSTSKFIITGIQNCLIGSSSLETCHCCVSTISYLPLPLMATGYCSVLRISLMVRCSVLSLPLMVRCFLLRGERCGQSWRPLPPLQAFCSSFQAPPHTSSYASVCLRHLFMAVIVFIYLFGVL